MDEADWTCECLGLGAKQRWMPTAANQSQTLHSLASVRLARDFNPKCLDA